MCEDSSNVKTPNIETPPQLQPISFTRHHPTEAPAVAHLPAVFYKECLKNHAARIGGMAVDGCGEFMPSAAADSLKCAVDSLKCAACGCHRSFHRRETEDPSGDPHFISFRLPPPLNHSPTPSPGRSPPRTAATPLSSAPHLLLALSNGFAGKNPEKNENPIGRKRFRTKFSHTQKQKMRAFAEKLGWKLQRSHESLAEELCSEIGVCRGVLKVWMHNNKHRDNQNETNSAHDLHGSSSSS